MELPVAFPMFNHLPGCRAWVDKRFPDYFGLNYAHAGQVSWSMEGHRPVPLVGPVAWWTWPGPRFAYGQPEPPGWDHRFATFRGRWAEDLAAVPEIFPRDRPWQILRDGEGFAGRMQALLDALSAQDDLRAWSRLVDLFLLLRDERANQVAEDSRVIRIRQVAEEIRVHPERLWSDEEGARRAGMSAPHFRRLFRSFAGLPFQRFVLRARMQEAARMLRTGDAPIKAIAEACGSNDIYQFSRQFRRVMGRPPAGYRALSRSLGA